MVMEDNGMTGATGSRMEVLAERTVTSFPPQPQLNPPPGPLPGPPPQQGPSPSPLTHVTQAQLQRHVQILRAMQATFRVMALLLAIRLLLLLAVAGSIALAVMAMLLQTPLALGTLAAYCVLGLGPLVYLERNARMTGNPQS